MFPRSAYQRVYLNSKDALNKKLNAFYTTKSNSTLLSNPIKIWNLQLASQFLQVRDENEIYATHITLNFHPGNASAPYWP